MMFRLDKNINYAYMYTPIHGSVITYTCIDWNINNNNGYVLFPINNFHITD